MNIKTVPKANRFGLNTVLAACVGLALAAAFNAPAQTLVQRWQNTSLDPGSRCVAVNPVSGNVLLVYNTPAIKKFSPADGSSAGADLDMTGVSGGQEPLRGIAIEKSGAIWACDYVLGASTSQTLNIYRWDDENAVPTVAFSLPPPLPGATGDRFGTGVALYIVPGVSTNLILGGTATKGMLVICDSTGWTSKLLTVDSQVLTPGASLIDYDAPGFPNKFRIVAKSRGSNGQLYNFDPSLPGPIDIRVGKLAMGAPFTYVANGITSHAYDPNTGFLAGTTSTLQASPYTYTVYLCSTANGINSPSTLSSVAASASGADGGTAGGTAWGPDGTLYSTIPQAGVGLQAFDITVYMIAAPVNTIGVVGDASATLSGRFGGTSLTYSWKKGAATLLTDSDKYSGTTTASLIVSNLTLADTDDYTVTVNGVNGSTTNATARLTVLSSPPGPKTWNGAGADDNWSTAANWNGVALNPAGDSAFFDGSTRLTPLMDSSYDLSGLTFNSGAGAFSISASVGATLSLSGGVTNLSVNEQVLNVPLSVAVAQAVDASAGDIVLNNSISGLGGLTKVGPQTLKLRGSSANTFGGPLTITEGAVALGKAPGANAVGDGISMAEGTVLLLEASDQLPDTALVDVQTGNATLALANNVTETIKATSLGGLGPLTVKTNSGNVQLGSGAQLTVKPDSSLSIGANAVTITAADPIGTKFIVDSAGYPGEVRWTPTNMVNTFEKLVVQNGGRLRCGHGGNAWLPQDTMLGAIPASFLADQITLDNGYLGLNSGISTAAGPDPTNTVFIHPNRGLTISSNATLETFQNVVLPGKITGTGTLIHTGGADLLLLGANDYTGGTQIGTGSLTIQDASGLGSGPVQFTSNLGALAVTTPGLVIANHIDLSLVITNTYGTRFNGTNFTLSGDVDLGDTGFPPQINVTNAASTITFGGTLTNSLGLVKGGLGTAVLTRANTYGGDTEVLAGTLMVNNTTGSGTSAGAVTVDPAGTLAGSGTVAGVVNLNGSISPGAGVGTLTTVDETWNSGGRYVFQMNDAAGTSGASPGWDKLVVNGPLFVFANPGAPFTIALASLAGSVPGNAANFDNTAPHSWTIASASGGIIGFDPSAVNVDVSAFSNALGAAYFDVTTNAEATELVLRLHVGTLGTGTGLMASYYNTPGQGEAPTIPDPPALVRLDSTVNFNWGVGSPDPLIDTNHFVVRWSGFVQPAYSQDYTFITSTDDGVRLWVDGQQVIDHWLNQALADNSSSPIPLIEGQKYGIVMEYFENTGNAVAILNWSTPNMTKMAIPQLQLYPATIPIQPQLTLSPDHTQISISWMGTFTLETAGDLAGPWTAVASSSPYAVLIDINQPQVFFRLVSQ